MAKRSRKLTSSKSRPLLSNNKNIKKHRNRLNGVVETVYSAATELQTTIKQIEDSGKDAKEALKVLQDSARRIARSIPGAHR